MPKSVPVATVAVVAGVTAAVVAVASSVAAAGACPAPSLPRPGTSSAGSLLASGVKGMLFVAPFKEYTQGALGEDVVLTKSMHKANFDIGKADLVVTGWSHGEKPRDTWNMQMITSLERQLGGGFMLPHVEKVHEAMKEAAGSPEGAMRFLRMVEDAQPSRRLKCLKARWAGSTSTCRKKWARSKRPKTS